MSFATIMVHLDLEGSNDPRLQVALSLAETFDAKLIGIAAVAVEPSYYPGETFTAASLEQLRSDATKRLAQAEDRFRYVSNSRMVEWRSAIAQPADYVSRQARAADLVLVGAQRDGLISDLAGSLDPGDLAMQAGRPILVVPPQVKPLELKLAMVCWKDTREARRAVSDALPLLKKMQEVVIVELVPNASSRDAAHGRIDDVIAWLKRHEVPAFARVFPCTAGDDPMEKLYLYGADLIVAGAYGHSRMREWVFGGFTYDLLHRSPVCTLLVH